MRIIVTGLIAQHYTMGGVAWDYLQYFAGLHRLGHEVYYLEDSGEWPYNLDGGETGNDWVAKDCNRNIGYLRQIMQRYGMEEQWAYRFPLSSEWFGLQDSKRKEIIRTADILLNVSGTLEHPDAYRQVKKLVYIDSDPGFTQVKMRQKGTDFERRVMQHDLHFSFGECLPENLKDPRIDWKPTRTPIILSEWLASEPPGTSYTTVMNWTSYKPLEFEGKVLCQKDVEFMRFLDLPAQFPGLRFEVALSRLQHANWQTVMSSMLRRWPEEILALEPADMLDRFCWHVVDPQEKCGDLHSYRDYIRSSRAEWSVAKGGYVTTGPGWFSCRSACYLAAGRPVVVQDTGFSKVFPVGEGVLPFSTPEESARALEELESDYSFHAKRAMEFADAYFDSDKVLTSLIERIG